MEQNYTVEELAGLYAFAKQMNPKDYNDTVANIVDLEKVQLDKEKLKMEHEARMKEIELEHQYQVEKLRSEEEFKAKELEQKKSEAETNKKLKIGEIAANCGILGLLGLAACFAEETRIIPKNLWGMVTKILPTRH